LSIPFILFISGVSGAGKTTILKKLCKQLSPQTSHCFHFDSIGIPTIDEMIEKYGSPSEWQYAMTQTWVNRLLTEYGDKPLLILEGQINLKFIEEICKKHNFKNYRIILIHADNEIRHQRLRVNRKQPALVNQDMDDWAAFLKRQAIDMKVSIFNSNSKNLENVVQEILKILNH
jgi:shikimate kinase